jgi:hypothetical protein
MESNWREVDLSNITRTNIISTTRYSVLSFIPNNLIEQLNTSPSDCATANKNVKFQVNYE